MNASNNTKLLILIFNLLSCFFFLSSCSESTDPKIEYGKVKLIAETTAASFLRMKLEITTEQKYDAFKVERDGHTVRESTITGTDTVFYDGGLEPQSAYHYKAFLLRKGCVIDTSITLTVNTTATSSHEFTWRVDTLGIFSSILHDVKVIDENNVWAAGEVRLDDPDTAYTSPLGKTNAVKWNGSDYEYYYIPVKTYDGHYGFQTLRSIIAFSRDDIWMFSYAGSYVRWNGTEWTSEFMWERKGMIRAAWGASADDFYAVGDNGTLVHYDGSKFTAVESGTGIDLFDIEGVVDENTGQQRIWAIGNGIVIYYNGESWNTIWNQEIDILQNNFRHPRSIYVPDHKSVILSIWKNPVARLYCFDQLNFYNNLFLADHNHWSLGMVGNNINDIAIVSEFDAIEHYNGSTVKRFDQLLGGGFLLGVDKTTNKIYAVGDMSGQIALFMHGWR